MKGLSRGSWKSIRNGINLCQVKIVNATKNMDVNFLQDGIHLSVEKIDEHVWRITQDYAGSEIGDPKYLTPDCHFYVCIGLHSLVIIGLYHYTYIPV